MYVCYGVRNGLYQVSSLFLRQSVKQLKSPIDRTPNDSFGFRLMVTFLDPFVTWLAVGLVVAGYVVVLLLNYNVLLHTMVIFLFMAWGNVFPIRLFIRAYRWITRVYLSDKPVGWLVVMILAWIVSLVLFYILFFSGLGIGYPLIKWMSEQMSDFSILLFKQAYIQHIQAFYFMSGFAVLYFSVDILLDEYKTELEQRK